MPGAMIQMMGSQVKIGIPLVYRPDPYKLLVTEAQVLVGLVAVPLYVPAADKSYMMLLRNSSAGGQIIRVGVVPAFGVAPAGNPLFTGDFLVLDAVQIAFAAIANGAGALLDCSIWST